MARGQIIVIANSRKHGGRCIAGLEPEHRRLIRPVSPIGSGALSDEECNVAGHTPELLETVRFTHSGRSHDPSQPENVTIDGCAWTSGEEIDPTSAFEILSAIAAPGPSLFGNQGRAVPEYIAARGVESSLAVVAPDALEFGHGPEAMSYRGSPRALFHFGDKDWNLPITDFEVGPRVLELKEGLYNWRDLGLPVPKNVLLTISLGMPHEGWHSKLVAGILRLF